MRRCNGRKSKPASQAARQTTRKALPSRTAQHNILTFAVYALSLRRNGMHAGMLFRKACSGSRLEVTRRRQAEGG